MIPPADAVGVLKAPVLDIDENLLVARLANRVARYTGDPALSAMAASAFAYVASPQVSEQKHFFGGLLSADEELSHAPLHLAVIGPHDDATALALHTAGLRLPYGYRQIDWWDPDKIPADAGFPPVDHPAAFVCGPSRCSSPVTDPSALAAAAKKVLAR